MTDTTPLPCPFCNSPAEIEEGSDHHGTWFNLGCSRHWGHVRNPDHTNTCIAGRIYYTETDVPLSEALTAWNTRANADARLVEALRECVAVLTDPIVGTIHHDDPDWYQALDRAVTKARAALSEVSQ